MTESGFDYDSKFGIRYHDLPENADASLFLCKELEPGFLQGITGVYKNLQGYYVDDRDVELFDRSFPPKEKLKLPVQISDCRYDYRISYFTKSKRNYLNVTFLTILR